MSSRPWPVASPSAPTVRKAKQKQTETHTPSPVSNPLPPEALILATLVLNFWFYWSAGQSPLSLVVYLTGWMAELIWIPVGWQALSIMRRPVSAWESFGIAILLLVFVFLSGLESLRTTARLASFSNKLGLAVLVAALIRVRDGFPAVLSELVTLPAGPDLFRGLLDLSLLLAPLLVIAAPYARRAPVRIAILGILVPAVLPPGNLDSVVFFSSRSPKLCLAPSVGTLYVDQ